MLAVPRMTGRPIFMACHLRQGPERQNAHRRRNSYDGMPALLDSIISLHFWPASCDRFQMGGIAMYLGLVLALCSRVHPTGAFTRELRLLV